MSTVKTERESSPKIDLSRFIQSRFNLGLVGLLPDGAARSYVRMLSRIFLSCRRESLAEVRLALSHCLPAATGQEAVEDIGRKVESGMADHYFEKMYLACRGLDRIRGLSLDNIRLDGEASLQAALAEGQGVLLVTGHYGGVELIPGALAFRGFPVTVMVHCKTPRLRARIERQAEETGVRLLDPKMETVFFSVVRELRQGRIVVTQCDEFDMWRPYDDRRIDFLRVNLGLDKSLDLLARKSRAKVLFGLNQRQPGGLYDLTIEDPMPPAGSGRSTLVSERCLSRLAARIEEHPEQWYEWKKMGKLIDRTGPESTRIIRLKPRVGGAPAPARPAEAF